MRKARLRPRRPKRLTKLRSHSAGALLKNELTGILSASELCQIMDLLAYYVHMETPGRSLASTMSDGVNMRYAVQETARIPLAASSVDLW